MGDFLSSLFRVLSDAGQEENITKKEKEIGNAAASVIV